MTMQFERFAIERIMRDYSNDLLNAFHSPFEGGRETKRNAIARAQSMLSDFDYLKKIADGIREQVALCQSRLD